jgi:hypothetical protein
MARWKWMFVTAWTVVVVTSATAAFAHPGEPDTVWTAPLPEGCLMVWDPVHDAQGQTYSNPCVAALQGVRVTWAGEGH